MRTSRRTPFFCARITSHFYTSNFKHSYENVQILSKMSNFVQNVQFCPVCPIVQICSIYFKLLRLKVSILFFFFFLRAWLQLWMGYNEYPKKFLVHCPNKKCTKHAQQKIIAVSTCIRSTVFENRSKMSRAKRLFTISICCVDEVLPNIFFLSCQTFPDFLKMKYDSNTHFTIKQIIARFAHLTSKKKKISKFSYTII